MFTSSTKDLAGFQGDIEQSQCDLRINRLLSQRHLKDAAFIVRKKLEKPDGIGVGKWLLVPAFGILGWYAGIRSSKLLTGNGPVKTVLSWSIGAIVGLVAVNQFDNGYNYVLKVDEKRIALDELVDAEFEQRVRKPQISFENIAETIENAIRQVI